MRKTNFNSHYIDPNLAKFIKHPGWLFLIFISLPLIVRDSAIPSFSRLHTQPSDPVDCQELIAQFTDNDFMLRDLADPIITDQSQIDVRLQKYTTLQKCLEAAPKERYNQELETIKNLVDYFLIFVGEDRSIDGAAKLERVDLAKSNDPAVVKLRDEIGVPAPIGWIFVHYYPSRQSMPENLQFAFENPQVAGVTILSKYIAILKEPKASWAERTLQELSSPNIMSHELVHAYVNSILAANHRLSLESFPRWFDEGLASYISQSDQPHTIITQNITLNETATEEYQSYVLIFKFLQNRLGQKGLNEKIRLALETADATQLYADIGIQDDRWLEITVKEWQRQRVQNSYFFGLIILGVTFAGLYFLLPELECSCGFTGRRRDFPGGKCPDCGEPVLGAQQQASLHATLSIYPDCQVCGRRFLPWQRRMLQAHKRLIRIWNDPLVENEPPLGRHVHRVCLPCLTHSQEIVEEYRRFALEKFDIARRKYHPFYRDWLQLAPPFITSPDGHLELALEQAIEQMLIAALPPTVTDWLDVRPLFRFIEVEEFDDSGFELMPPPQKYDRILRDIQSGRYGSVYQSGENKIVVSWEF
jgi:hypothetical protein